MKEMVCCFDIQIQFQVDFTRKGPIYYCYFFHKSPNMKALIPQYLVENASATYFSNSNL